MRFSDWNGGAEIISVAVHSRPAYNRAAFILKGCDTMEV